MITNKVAEALVVEISDHKASAELTKMIAEKVDSKDFIVITWKEYSGMLKAIQNFQKKKR